MLYARRVEKGVLDRPKLPKQLALKTNDFDPQKISKKKSTYATILKENKDFFPHEKLEKLSSKVARNS